MKQFLLTIIFSFTAIAAMSQYRYSVENCWEMTKNNYPAIKYFDLINKSTDYSLLNASELRMPRQIDAISYSPTSKDSKTAISFAEKNNISTYNALHSIKSTSSNNQNPLVAGSLQSNLYILSERVNNLFFAIVLIDKQLKINELLQLDLVEMSKLFTASKDNKLNNSVNIKGMTALLEKAKKDYITLLNLQKVYLDMLSQMVGRTIDKKTVLILPNIEQHIKKSVTVRTIGLIDNSKYNPYTNRVNIAPKNFIYDDDNYRVFDVAKVKVNSKNEAIKNKFPNFEQSILNRNAKEQQEFSRSEINTLCIYIENDYRNINNLKEYIIISYNKISRGITDISNLTQNILNYIEAQNQLSAHTVQLMMEANKFTFLYQ